MSKSVAPAMGGTALPQRTTARQFLLPRVAWIPIPLVVLLWALLSALHFDNVFEPAWLLPTINSTVFVGVSLMAAMFAAMGFSEEGYTPLLFLGCGMLVFGIGSMISPVFLTYLDKNAGVTVHNLNALVAGALHTVSGVTLWLRSRPVARRGLLLILAYAAATLAAVALAVLTEYKVLPLFLHENGATTPLRASVLTVTILLFLTAGSLIGAQSNRPDARFLRWYSLGMALTGLGLAGVAIAPLGTPMSWLGRGSQSLGQIYVLVCMLISVRQSNAEGATGVAVAQTFRRIEGALRDSRERYSVLLEAAEDGIVLYEPTASGDLVLEANPAFLELLEYSRDDLVFLSMEDVVLGKMPKSDPASLVRGRRRPTSLTLVSKSGRKIPVEMSMRSLRYEGKHVVLCVVRDITHRIEAQRALERESALTSGINEILRAALTSKTEEELGRACLTVAQSATGSAFGFIGEVDEDGLYFDLALSDTGWDACSMTDASGHKGSPMNLETLGIWSHVLRSRQSITSNNVERDERSGGLPEGHPAVTSFLGTPIAADGKTLGMIGVANRTGGYRTADKEALEAFAPAIAQALGRFRAEMEISDAARLAEALTDIEGSVHSSLNQETIIRAALKDSARVLGASNAFLTREASSGFVITHAWGLSPDVIGREMPADSCMCAEPLRTRQPALVRDAEAELVGTKRQLLSLGVHAMMVVPLKAVGKDAGCLYFNFDRRRRFSQAEVNFASRLSSSLALALENSRLYESERERRHHIEALHDVTEVAVSSLNPAEATKRVLHYLVAHHGFDYANVWMREGDSLALIASVGYPPQYEQYSPMPLSSELDSPKVFRTGEPVVVPDATNANPVVRHLYDSLDAPLGAYVIMPLRALGKTIGTLNLGWKNARKPERLDLEFYASIGNEVGIVLENARLYESQRGIAETLQETLVVLPSHAAGVNFTRAYESATYEPGRVGGDFVDVFEVHGNNVGIVLGDVSGKGIDAAVTTSLVRNTIRIHAIDGLPPSVLMEKTNRAMRRFSETEAYVTLFFALLNTKTGLLRYVCAGHPPAILLSPDSEMTQLACTDPILGAFDDLAFSEKQMVMHSGDQLILYSDGVTEARAPDGTFFTLDRLLSEVLRSPGISTDRLAEQIMTAVKEFSNGVLRDDAAVLVVEPNRLRHRGGEQPQLELA